MRKVKMNYRCLSTGSLIKVILVFLGGLKRYRGGLKSNPHEYCSSHKKLLVLNQTSENTHA